MIDMRPLFLKADMLKFERVNRESLDEDLTKTLRNDPRSVGYTPYAQVYLQGATKMLQRDNDA